MGIVCTTFIRDIRYIEKAKWNDTKHDECAKSCPIPDYGEIALVGVRHKEYKPTAYFAINQRTGRVSINGFHIKLAKYLIAKFDEYCDANNGELTVREFIDDLDEDASKISVELICLECGACLDSGDDRVRNAINRVSFALRALGVPAGDWSFAPMLRAYIKATKK